MAQKIILLVEDEPDIVKTLKIFLESEGFRVLTASDGIEGMQKIKEEKLNLIILDIMLPRLDGYKVCRMVKFDKKLKKIPVIIFTARAQETDRKMAAEVGADAYITKPFKPEALLDKIKELIR